MTTDSIPSNSPSQGKEWPAGLLGEVSLEPRTPVVVGTKATWTFRYITGPYGVDDGGGLKFLVVIPSDRGIPQFDDPTAAEYVSVRTTGSARLVPRWATKAFERPWSKGIHIDVTEGALAPGDLVEVIWGDSSAGGPGATAQSFADESSTVRVMVDAFATNVYKDLPGETSMDFIPGPATRLIATAESNPTNPRSARMTIRAVDRFGNVATGYNGNVAVSSGATEIAHLEFSPGDRGIRHLAVPLGSESAVARFEVTDPAQGFHSQSNPVVRQTRGMSLYWGDTQGQTGETVGSGSLSSFFEYARDAVQLDFVTHSANDFQVTNEAYAESLSMVDAYTKDGEFIAFGGFEWSGNTPVGGDHNILYADTSDAPLLRSSHALVDDHEDLHTDCRTIQDVYDTFQHEGIDAVTVCHVGGRRAQPSMVDTGFTPVLEMTSVHGWFEWFALDVIREGKDIGLVAASDDHSGRPGGSFPSLPLFGVRSGLAAVRAADLSRRGLMEGMRSRDTYATTGERMVLDVAAGEHRMGEAWEDTEAPTVVVSANGTAPIEVIDVMNPDGVLASWRPASRLSERRLRVSWRGARIKDRSRVQTWDGGLQIEGAEITGSQTWAFDHPDQGILERSNTGLTWTSTTNGDVDGVVLELTGRPNRLLFTAGGVDLDLDLTDLGETPMEIPVEAGIDRAVVVEWLPTEDLPLDASTTFDSLPFRPGRNVYLVRVTQADGHRAWASPLYIYSDAQSGPGKGTSK